MKLYQNNSKQKAIWDLKAVNYQIVHFKRYSVLTSDIPRKHIKNMINEH